MRLSRGILFACIACISGVVAASGDSLVERAAPSPISVSPAQNWDGYDGPWSSFTIRVGTPAQDVRVFISTAGYETWVVLPQGCPSGDSSCPEERGDLFNNATSSTWKAQGYYHLILEENLGIDGVGYFGNDTVGLGIQGSGGPTLENQVVGGIATENYYLGVLGVNPKPINFTSLDEGQPSYISSLKEQSLIPSVSFGYTAGAQYRLKQVDGSLTLGGYDASRFTPNNLSFAFAPDNSRDVVVGIQSLIATDQDGKTHNLLTSGIDAYIDSTVSQIWLPLSACEAFEEAFGLVWDTSSELYLVNDTLHSALLAQNASFSFTLGNTVSGGETIDIVLPYASFDLQATYPLVANSTRYFPLKRAVNETQYTLGRTFLQEAYLIVDWERSNFSVSQCLFEEDMQEKLEAIQAPGNSSTSGSGAGNSTSTIVSKSSVSTGAIAGIVVGIVIVVILAVAGLGAFFILRRRKRRNAEAKLKSEEEADRLRTGFGKAELDTDSNHQRYEIDGNDPNSNGKPPPGGWVDEKARFPGAGSRTALSEMKGSDANISELAVGAAGASELSQDQARHEMYDPSATPVELPADLPPELPGSEPSTPGLTSSLTSSPVFRSANQSPVNRSAGPSPLNPASSPLLLPHSNSANRVPLANTRRGSAASPRSQPSDLSTPPNRSLTSTPRTTDALSPISPLPGEDHRQGGIFSGGIFGALRNVERDQQQEGSRSASRSRGVSQGKRRET